MLLYLVSPVGYFLFKLPWGDVPGQLADPNANSALITSILSATVSIVIIAVLGVPLGYMLARRTFTGRGILTLLVYLPLVFPPVVSGILLLLLYGPYGPIGGPFTNAGFELDSTFTGVVLAQIFVASPFVIIAARAAFEAVDPALEQVAVTLGKGSWEVFWRVNLPVARVRCCRRTITGLVTRPRRIWRHGNYGLSSLHFARLYLCAVEWHGRGCRLATGLARFSREFRRSKFRTMDATHQQSEESGMKSVMRETNYTTRMQALEAQYSDEVAETPPVTNGNRMLNVKLHHQLGAFQLAIQFQVPLGLIVLLGSSGAGKSLTLKGIAGLLHPQQGHIAVNEQVLFDREAGTNVPAQLRHIGYVPQHYALFPHLTVAENILFALPSSRTNARWTQWRKQRADRRTRVAELLSILELDGLERRYPATLSGGQQQRVALARALAAEPHLLLLDEPFNALDAAVRERLRDTLKQFQRRFAIPIVLVTHDHAEAQQLADTIVVVQHGQVAQVGSVNNIFYSPRTPDVAQLVGQHNVFTAHLSAPSTHSNQQKFVPQAALCLHHLKSSNAVSSLSTSQVNEGSEYNWLPCPTPALHSRVQNISGCIRTDEVYVHRISGEGMLPVWTAQGSAQWPGVLQEAQLYGHMVRLLIHPCLQGVPASDPFFTEAVLEVYLSRRQWRDVEVASGQQLVLEIPSKAIHLFDIPAM